MPRTRSLPSAGRATTRLAVLYIDSSALVKLYVSEEHSPWTLDLVRGAGIPSAADREAGDDEQLRRYIREAREQNAVAVSAIAWVECCAAFAAKERVRALTRSQRLLVEGSLARDLRDAYLVRPVSGSVLREAGMAASRYALRAYDAVQLATAIVLRSEMDAIEDADPEARVDQVLMLSYDRDLHSAAVEAGIAHACPGRSGGSTFPVR